MFHSGSSTKQQEFDTTFSDLIDVYEYLQFILLILVIYGEKDILTVERPRKVLVF